MEEVKYQDMFAKEYKNSKGKLTEQEAIALRDSYEQNQKQEYVFDPLEGCTVSEELKARRKKQMEEQEVEMQ